MDYEKKYITIFDFILEILMHNCGIFYEELGEEFIEKFEMNYRSTFKNIILDKIKEGKLSETLKAYFDVDRDEYGLFDIESDLKYELDEICRDLCNEIDVDTRIFKNNMEKSELSRLQKENKSLKKLNLEIDKKNDEIEELKNINDKLKDKIDESNSNIRDLKSNLKDYENKIKQMEETLEFKNNLSNLDLNEDILKLKEENLEKQNIIEENEKNIKHLKEMINICKNNKTKKVNEINQDCENKINSIKEEQEQLKIYYKDEIKKYENEINRLNSEIFERKKMNDKASEIIKKNKKLENQFETFNLENKELEKNLQDLGIQNKELKLRIEHLTAENKKLKNKKVEIINQDNLNKLVIDYRKINELIIEKVEAYYRGKCILAEEEEYRVLSSKFKNNRKNEIRSKEKRMKEEKNLTQKELSQIQEEVNQNILDIINLIEKLNKIHNINNIDYRFGKEINKIQEIQKQLRGE